MTTNSGSSEPRCVADLYGLGSLADGDHGVDPEVLRDLYRHARGQDGQRQMFTGDPTFAKGWVDLNSLRAHEIISRFVALDDADDLKSARKIARANLEAQAWNDVLDIDTPIRCRIKIHGSKWGVRFEGGTPGLRGREILNEQLPAMAGDDTAEGHDGPADGHDAAAGDVPSGGRPTADSNGDAADVLRRGGLPA